MALFEDERITPEEDQRNRLSGSLWENIGQEAIDKMSEEQKTSMQRTIDKLTEFKMQERKPVTLMGSKSLDVYGNELKLPTVDEPEPEPETAYDANEVWNADSEDFTSNEILDFEPPEIGAPPERELRVKPPPPPTEPDLGFQPREEGVLPSKEQLGMTPELTEKLKKQIVIAEEFGRSLAVERIKGYEGYSEEAYYFDKDEEERGIITVGYGSTSLSDPGITMDTTMTKEEATASLNKNLDAVWDKVNNLSDISAISLNPNQKAALASMLYNINPATWMKSNARKALIAGDLDLFKYEAFDKDAGFVKGSGKVIPGLQKRRGQEQELFETEYTG